MRTLETLKRFKPSRAQLIGACLISSSGLVAYAVVPNSFTAGTPISATQVNANFSDLDTRLVTQEGANAASRLGVLETTVNGGNIALVPSTATTGNIIKGGVRFLHDFGLNGSSTFLGRNSGNFTMTGTNNTAVGFNTLTNIGSGLDNVAMGLNALANNTSADSNTGVGVSAMFATTSGAANVAVGTFALESNSLGGANTVVGYGAGRINTGSGNIALGVNAGSALTTGDNNIVIGHVGAAGNVGTIRIGTLGMHGNAFIAGIRGITTTVADAIPVFISSAGQLGTISSSQRVKDDIADMSEASSTLMKLRPVTFHYKSDQNPKGRSLQYGLIAEEVEQVAPSLVARNAKGEIETVYYQHLAPMLLNEYQKQQRVIGAQTERLAALEVQAREIVALKQQLAKVTAALARLEQTEKVARAGR